MWHRVKDLSPDQRLILEGLLGVPCKKMKGSIFIPAAS